MRVLVSGSGGLIGSALVSALHSAGHQVTALVRRTPAPGEVAWDPAAGVLELSGLDGIDAVVNLNGAGIGDRRWTEARRRVLVASRVDSTDLLARTMAAMTRPPSVFVCASAVGIYGDRGEDLLTEDSPVGEGFLADLCRQWERAAQPARAAGIRTVSMRSGVVLSAAGGALGRQLPLFRLGLGGPLSSGRQWMSWISMEDHVRATVFALEDERVVGAVNAVAPNPVRNRQQAIALGRALKRPALLPVPAPALRLVLGRQLVDEVLLASQRVVPQRLTAAGFVFRHPDIEGAMTSALRR